MQKFTYTWRNKLLTAAATTIDEMIEQIQEAVECLTHMKEDGFYLEADGGAADDYAHLVTTDPAVAEDYDLDDEDEVDEEEDEEIALNE